MQGTIRFSDPVNLRIQGSFEGKLQAKGQLTIGDKAHVKAELEVDRVIVAGKAEGKIIAREWLHVTSTGQCIGPVWTSSLMVEEGGFLQGECQVKKETVIAPENPSVEVKGEILQNQERRQWPRLDLSDKKGKGVLVRVTLGSGKLVNGYARNISAGGVFIKLPIKGEFPPEFPLRVFFPGCFRPLKTTGKLVWNCKDFNPSSRGVAVKFGILSSSNQKTIQRFVGDG